MLATDRQSTTVRAIESRDVRRLVRLIDNDWRVHLRISPLELPTKIVQTLSFLAEDRVGLRGFIMAEPLPSQMTLLIAVGLRDTWSVPPCLDLLLPPLEQAMLNNDQSSLVYIGNSVWLVDDLKARGFEVREWVMAFERQGTNPPPPLPPSSVQMRTAHYHDLAELMALDQQAFTGIWHKSLGNFNEALARAASFTVAIVDSRIVAYEWCEIYQDHAHLTRLAVHPDYQGRGIGAQLLHQAITDALSAGANFITLNTQENNRRSRALYERFGFAYTQQKMPVLWKELR